MISVFLSSFALNIFGAILFLKYLVLADLNALQVAICSFFVNHAFISQIFQLILRVVLRMMYSNVNQVLMPIELKATALYCTIHIVQH